MAAGYDISASASQSTAVNSAAGPTSSGGINFSGANFDFGGGSNGLFVAPGSNKGVSVPLLIAGGALIIFLIFKLRK